METMTWNLLEKTTFWIEGIELENVDLKILSETVGKIFNMAPEKEIMVVDVRPGLVVFDVLKQDISPEQVVGKGKEILTIFRSIPGIKISDDAQIHSEGILGLIAAEKDESKEILERSRQITNEIEEKIKKRIIVFASGNELIEGKIKDTNSPYLMQLFKENDFDVKYGGILPDDPDAMVSYLEDALNEGFGYIIITGGTGAEDKDYTARAIDAIASHKAQSYILKFIPGSNYASHYHHVSDGVKITVGVSGITKIIGLPGPHEEIKLISQNLLDGIKNNLNENDLSEIIAAPLRLKWNESFKNHHI
ncbi:MAG: molybdopterin-binding protein [Caldisphaera sp.]|uniref:molybdopterin-binding protein n=1 Tax=Caldisphaera sp. TaxID=2060322 RepID=UPI003D0F15D1